MGISTFLAAFLLLHLGHTAAQNTSSWLTLTGTLSLFLSRFYLLPSFLVNFGLKRQDFSICVSFEFLSGLDCNVGSWVKCLRFILSPRG